MSETEALAKKIEQAMRLLSEISSDSEQIGKGNLRYAANRAWNELFDLRAVLQKDTKAGEIEPCNDAEFGMKP